MQGDKVVVALLDDEGAERKTERDVVEGEGLASVGGVGEGGSRDGDLGGRRHVEVGCAQAVARGMDCRWMGRGFVLLKFSVVFSGSR